MPSGFISIDHPLTRSRERTACTFLNTPSFFGGDFRFACSHARCCLRFDEEEEEEESEVERKDGKEKVDIRLRRGRWPV